MYSLEELLTTDCVPFEELPSMKASRSTEFSEGKSLELRFRPAILGVSVSPSHGVSEQLLRNVSKSKFSRRSASNFSRASGNRASVSSGFPRSRFVNV